MLTNSIKRLRLAFGMVTLVFLVCPDLNAQVQRCVDSSGHVEYRATHCDSNTKGRSLPIGESRSAVQEAGPVRASSSFSISGASAPSVQPVTPPNDAQLPVLRQAPPSALAAYAELVVVSGYEPSPTGVTRVRLNRPGKRVLLVLSTAERTLWRVEASAGTTVAGVVLASSIGDSGVMADSPIPVYLTRLPHAYETDNIKFRQMLQQLNAWFGVTRVDAIRGKYQLPASVAIDELDPGRADLTLQGVASTAPAATFGFELLTHDFRKVSFRNDGSSKAPAGGQSLFAGSQTAISSSGKEAYTLTGAGLQLTDTTSGHQSQLPLPASFPAFSWPTAVACDVDLNIVTVVTLGGEGFLYRYDAKHMQWLDYRSLNNIDITSLAYDPQAKRYMAWTMDGALLSLSNKGELLGSQDLKEKLPGFFSVYDRGNERPPALTLAPRGPQIALVHIEGNEVSMIWTYSEQTGQAQLTYKRDLAGEQPTPVR